MHTPVGQALCFLHNCKPAIIHRDLKPANLLIGRGMKLKVGDFSLSRVKCHDMKVYKMTGRTGTLREYVCMHLYVCVCMHLCVCVYAFMCVCVYAFMCVCVYAFMCVCIYVCMCVCIYVCMHLCVCVCLCVASGKIGTCVCVYVCMFMWTCT